MPNTYVLVIQCHGEVNLEVGSLGDISFQEGLYCYVGSSRNNSFSRLERHTEISENIKTTRHWHIDYLNGDSDTDIIEAYTSNSLEECEVASKFEEFENVAEFGCSDCQCDSHLFYADNLEKIEELLNDVMDNKIEYGSGVLSHR